MLRFLTYHCCAGLQILAVTTSANVALRVTDLLQDTALRHGVKVTAIVTGEEDPSRFSDYLRSTVDICHLSYLQKNFGRAKKN